MPRQTKAQLEEQIRDLKRWYDELAQRNKELLIDLDNAKNEIAKLKKLGGAEHGREARTGGTVQ